MTRHVDDYGGKGKKVTIVSVVLTLMETGTLGGHVRFSGLDSGRLHPKYKRSVDFVTKDNMLYFFPGSYVEHCVSRVRNGSRLAIVMFLKWQDATPIAVIQFWTGSPFICDTCLHAFKTNKSLNAHLKNNSTTPKKCMENKYIIIK
jgi:hypothetical protein